MQDREITPSGVRYDANSVDECYGDEASLVPGAPLDGSIPGLELVRAFEDRIVEKLWVFNADHATAAYLGWHAGCETIDEAMTHEGIRAAVSVVVREAQQSLEAYLSARPGSVPIPTRRSSSILDLYADPALDDAVVRVARDPRRKLAADDRLVGPTSASLAAGIRPEALARVIAAALAYGEESDRLARADHGSPNRPAACTVAASPSIASFPRRSMPGRLSMTTTRTSWMTAPVFSSAGSAARSAT